MGAHSYKDLVRHIGHKIVCVGYGSLDSDFSDDMSSAKIVDFHNAAIECETCNEVLLDFDKIQELEEDVEEYVKCWKCQQKAVTMRFCNACGEKQ